MKRLLILLACVVMSIGTTSAFADDESDQKILLLAAHALTTSHLAGHNQCVKEAAFLMERLHVQNVKYSANAGCREASQRVYDPNEVRYMFAVSLGFGIVPLPKDAIEAWNDYCRKYYPSKFTDVLGIKSLNQCYDIIK